MLDVDNSGKGNCLYYAYGISLMYYLRAKADVKITEDIFNKLGLKEEDKSHLRPLLAKDIDRAFTREEIQKFIEPILGKATRNLAATYTKIEFKSSPFDSPLFSSLHYAVEFGFKRALELFESDLTGLIENNFSNPNYLEAEIYKVDGLLEGLQEYILDRTPALIQEFNEQWAKKLVELNERHLTEKELQVQKIAVLENILRSQTIQFLSANNEEYLNAYIERLRGEYVWGCEETLMVLHRAIQGERKLRDAEGTVSFSYDHEINLHIHRDGVSAHPSDNPEMILNNQGNAHWTSSIPDSIFTDQFADKEVRLSTILERMKTEWGSKELGVEKYGTLGDWLCDLVKQIAVIKASPTSITKQKEIDLFFQLLGKATPKLALDPILRMALSTLFSHFLECVPDLMAENKVNKGLAKFGLYSLERSAVTAIKEESLDPSQKTVSQLTHLPLPKVLIDTPAPSYPSELVPYVRKAKQSGPRVARALQQMYQKGLDGDERYNPEKCKDIAERYINYSKANNRHFMLSEVHAFVHQMDKLIKQKEVCSDNYFCV